MRWENTPAAVTPSLTPSEGVCVSLCVVRQTSLVILCFRADRGGCCVVFCVVCKFGLKSASKRRVVPLKDPFEDVSAVRLHVVRHDCPRFSPESVELDIHTLRTCLCLCRDECDVISDAGCPAACAHRSGSAPNFPVLVCPQPRSELRPPAHLSAE